MWQGINRRKFPRVNYPCKIVVIKDSHKDKIATRTENIGVGGVCVVINKPLNRYDDAGVILYLGDGHQPVCCDGKVVWVVKKSASEYDTGIEFTALKDSDRLRIERVIQLCQKEQGFSTT
jgi:Tfp pilus assembly protein PilZ